MNAKIGIGVIIAAIIVGGIFIFTRPKDEADSLGYSTDTSADQSNNLQIDQQEAMKKQTSSAGSANKKQYSKFTGVLSDQELTNKKAVIVTNKGTIEFEILTDAPMASSNFIKLSKDGYYDGLTFHRVVPGFVIQGGDPTGTGAGGPGYQFEDEPVTREYTKGIVAMANAGPDTNGSQFFIMLDDNALPPSYTIFGEVLSGQEVVDTVQVGDVMQKVTIEDNN